MSSEDVFDHQLAHTAYHAGRVRIVHNDSVERAIDEMEMLFPHEAVIISPIGCRHACVYTSAAPASLIEERIEEHRCLEEHLPALHGTA